MANITQLKEKLQSLAISRNMLEIVSDEYQKRHDELVAELAPLAQRKKALKEETESFKSDVDALAISVYEETNNKKPLPEIEIKQTDTLIIHDEKALIEWLLRENMHGAIKMSIDSTVLKKLINLMPDQFASDTVKALVELKKEPKSYVASNLSHLLEG